VAGMVWIAPTRNFPSCSCSSMADDRLRDCWGPRVVGNKIVQGWQQARVEQYHGGFDSHFWRWKEQPAFAEFGTVLVGIYGLGEAIQQ